MQLSISNYLLTRLKELGIDHIFGVPGDYNLSFLDQIINFPTIEWVGTCNELNGAYASDGYARIKGAGALVTTFGVGELSAINGIAGAYAELAPVVKIVGMPATSVLEQKSLVHHTLGDGRTAVFFDIYKNITLTQTILNKNNAGSEIDRVLLECWRKKRPVYIGLPSDLVEVKIEGPTSPLSLTFPNSNPDAIAECVERIAELVTQAKSPIILADLCADRFPMKAMLQTLLDTTKIPFANMNMAKGLINESHSQYLGNYCGELSQKSIRDQVENSDCLITIGSMMSDLNTGGFSTKLNANNSIEIHSYFTRVKQSYYHDILFKDLLPALTKRLANYHCPIKVKKPEVKSLKPSSSLLTQHYFWDKVGECINKNAIVLAETGTSLFGALQMSIPDEVKFISQALWGSIGYSLGALLGAKIAAPDKQVILFIGDGSFQLTGQEVSTMMRYKLNPIIFLINNHGYTIERLIHGAKMPYNDIAEWQYGNFVQSFQGKVQIAKVKTEMELEEVIKEIKNGALNKNQLAFIDVSLEKMDAPEILVNLGKVMEKRNKGEMAISQP